LFDAIEIRGVFGFGHGAVDDADYARGKQLNIIYLISCIDVVLVAFWLR
jgi:hypothetical protein